MSGFAVGFGVGLAVLGVGSYLVSGQSSPTALIPAAFGLALVAAGLVARRPSCTKHAMHAAVVIALLGALGSFGGIPDAGRILAGAPVANPLAAWSKTLMSIGLAVFVGLCIRSFRQARKANRREPASA